MIPTDAQDFKAQEISTESTATTDVGLSGPTELPARPATRPGGPLDLQQAFGNSAIRMALQSLAVQTKLAVSQPGDIYEQEADQVAQTVMRMPAPASSVKRAEGPETLQRKPLFPRLSSFIQRRLKRDADTENSTVSGSLESQINGTRGGGQPLSSSAREFFEPRFGVDFSQVRIHTDNEAVQMNRAVGARAFSLGSDIYYGPGNSPSDLELTAHELTHVVQQTGDGEILTKADPTIQRAVDTNGGKFDTTTYSPSDAPTGAKGERVGAHIVLEFTANDLVESTKIGMIQSVKAMKSSKVGGTNDTSAAITAGDQAQLVLGPKSADPNRKIDRVLTPPDPANPGSKLSIPNTSPIYGVHNTVGSSATTLGQGTPSTGTSQWGSHTKDPITGAFLAAVPARIDDSPGRVLEFTGQTIEHTFEAAALAVEGPIPPNTYLGSVSWGYRSDAAGKVTTLPVTLVGAGPPSAEFMAAAAKWNAATFHDTATDAESTPVAIPITTFMSTPPASRSTSSLVIQIAKLTDEIGKLPPGTDKVNKEFEKRACEAELAKRADQPTKSLADQEAAAALLTTPALITRSDALPAEISVLAASPQRTDKELEQEAVKREIAKRRILIKVHVHETEDVIGSDSVYVKASSAAGSQRTRVIDLNDGQEYEFVIPLSALFSAPATKGTTTLDIKAYDEDWEGDDLMFDKSWTWSSLPAEETQSRDGGKYTVRIDFAQLR